MADLDQLAMAMPQTIRQEADGRPRIPDLARIDRKELGDTIAEAWLTRAQKRVARAWLEQQAPADE